MSDRRILINERVDTLRLKQSAHDLTYYGFEAINRYKTRVDAYNPGLQPLTERTYMRLALNKQGLPAEFRQEWKGADETLTMLLQDIRVFGKPEPIWKSLFQKFQYATELPNRLQALGFLNLANARLTGLVNIKDHPDTTSVTWAARIYVENMMLKGGLMGGTFFIPPDKPNLN